MHSAKTLPGFPNPAAPAQSCQSAAYWVYPGVRARVRRLDYGPHATHRYCSKAVFEGDRDDLVRAGLIDADAKLPMKPRGCILTTGCKVTMCFDGKIRVALKPRVSAARDEAFQRFLARTLVEVPNV
jgi:hypothetical protein